MNIERFDKAYNIFITFAGAFVIIGNGGCIGYILGLIFILSGYPLTFICDKIKKGIA